ncbi:eisosome protein 1 domain-containing protein [Sarocladium implicatum]|nr:eisosome protein 1 domain-containing protein [Sarocladium implicatum]
MVEASSTQVNPAAAGGRLKYADPKSLPSYPSSGLRSDGAAAGAAASLGWSNQKSIEPWRPDKTSASSAAAALAKDYKMAPSWEPSSDSAGRKAALLAVGSASAALKRPNSPTKTSPSKTSTSDGNWGNSAATQAFNASRATADQKSDLSHGNSAATQAFNINRSLSVRKAQATPSPTIEDDRSLAAAKGAMSSNRPRAISTPSQSTLRTTSAADRSSTANALSGAAIAHRASMTSTPVGNAGAVPVTTMTRNMFTSNPPVKPEVTEQENNDKIHASAVAMARKMYAHQQRMVDQTQDAQDQAGNRGSGHFVNLQDAAYKQAQERLSKLQGEHIKNREYQEYYGGAQPQSPKRRFSMAAKLRRKNSSDDEFDDHEESQKIRQQMSMFSNKVSQIDEAKRQKDRDAVLAAAQRNVKARLQGMDEKVYRDTGKINPSMTSDWEERAQAAARSHHETRTVNKGKIDIGGGRFMDPEEVQAIASSRVQPVLDDINDKAEAERERRLALKAEEEARKDEEQRRREREKEVALLNKQAQADEKAQLKAQRDEEKAHERERKEAEKAKKAEEKRLAKEEKRKSKQQNTTEQDTQEEEHDTEAAVPATTTVVTAGTGDDETPAASSDAKSPSSPSSPTSPGSKVKGWIKNRFSRGKSIGEKDRDADGNGKRRSFFGGAALRDSSAANGSATSLDHRASSMRDVAMAGKNSSRGRRDSSGVSPASTPAGERCDPLSEVEPSPMPMTPPPRIADPVVRTSVSPSRDSRFREEM